MAKVSVNKETCIGCGTCAEICPKIFEIKGGKSHPKIKEVKGAEEDCAKKAKEACPTNSISVK